MNVPVYYLLSALAVLIILAIHEYAHAYAAYKLGDETARNFGRLTLNPIKHLDPIGALCMLFFHIGWAKPVPINARNFKNPRRDCAITALAGPLVNIIMAFFSALIYLIIYSAAYSSDAVMQNDFAFELIRNTLLFVSLFHTINLGLGIFNLIPIPPFDGSRIIYAVLPPKAYFGVMKHERKIYFGVLLWLFLGDYVAMALRAIPVVATTPWLYTITGIFSLSGMLASAIEGLSGLMFEFWMLIPIFNI